METEEDRCIVGGIFADAKNSSVRWGRVLVEVACSQVNVALVHGHQAGRRAPWAEHDVSGEQGQCARTDQYAWDVPRKPAVYPPCAAASQKAEYAFYADAGEGQYGKQRSATAQE